MSAQCNKVRGLLALGFVALALAGCSTAPVSKTPGTATTAQNPAAYDQAIALMESGDMLAAEAELQDLTRKYPGAAGPWVNLAIIYSNTERMDQVEAALMHALELNPNSAEAYNQLGIFNRREGRFDDAAQAYAKAIEIAPDYGLAYLNYGVLMDLYLQQPEQALAYYERFQDLEGGDDQQVARWIAEVERRVATQTAQASQ